MTTDSNSHKVATYQGSESELAVGGSKEGI